MKFIAQGGLGNQLFILAEVIRCQRAFYPLPDVNIYLNSDSKDSILKFLGYFPGISIKFSPVAHLKFQAYLTLSSKQSALKLLRNFFPRVWMPKDVSESLSKQILSQKGLFAGYFQNSETVESVWGNLEVEIIQVLAESKKLLADRINYKDYAVVHVRRGDYMQNLKSYGVLSSDYYKRVVELNDYPIIVSTDDYVASREITSLLKPKLVVGPAELNNWQTLELMSNAKQVFAANSSLSWWAAYLAIKKGNQAYLPKPWFVSNANNKPKLDIDGAKYIEAKFLT